MIRTLNGRLNHSIAIVALVVAAVVAFVYWPVIHATFFLDNVIDFVDMKWLSHGMTGSIISSKISTAGQITSGC